MTINRPTDRPTDQPTDRLAGRHAYLIIAHNNFRILEKSLSLLDDERNDIYLHIDLKTEDFPEELLKSAVKKGNLIFTPRISVNWGGYSQIQAEVLLLKEATRTLHAYYHLLSGVDLPIKTQEQIHAFFDENQGKEFIRFDPNVTTERIHERIRYHYLLQDKIGRNTGLKIAVYERAENLILKIQKSLHIDRTKKVSETFYKGTNWFSITQGLAEYVVSRESEIRKTYKNTICADEIFLHTLAKNSKYAASIVDDSLRLVDWKRGDPYTFTFEDYDMIISSDRLFARKFDEDTDMKIVKKIYRTLI